MKSYVTEQSRPYSNVETTWVKINEGTIMEYSKYPLNLAITIYVAQDAKKKVWYCVNSFAYSETIKDQLLGLSRGRYIANNYYPQIKHVLKKLGIK